MQVYDATPFLNDHPGGPDAIMLAAGTVCALPPPPPFASPFSPPPPHPPDSASLASKLGSLQAVFLCVFVFIHMHKPALWVRQKAFAHAQVFHLADQPGQLFATG